MGSPTRPASGASSAERIGAAVSPGEVELVGDPVGGDAVSRDGRSQREDGELVVIGGGGGDARGHVRPPRGVEASQRERARDLQRTSGLQCELGELDGDRRRRRVHLPRDDLEGLARGPVAEQPLAEERLGHRLHRREQRADVVVGRLGDVRGAGPRRRLHVEDDRGQQQGDVDRRAPEGGRRVVLGIGEEVEQDLARAAIRGEAASASEEGPLQPRRFRR